MAGDWIKVRVDLHDDPAVIGASQTIGVSENELVGALVKLWGWASRQSRDGHAPSVTPKWVDRHAGVTGLADALQKAGWLVISDAGIEIPRFERHMSQSAKRRALNTCRQQERRADFVTPVSPSHRDQVVTREEKRREEEDEEGKSSPPPSEPPKKTPPADPGHKAAWNALAEKHNLPRVSSLSAARAKKLAARLAEHPDLWDRVGLELGRRNSWARENRFPTFDQAIELRTLTKLLEGNFRDPAAHKAPDPVDDTRHKALVGVLRARRGQTAVDARGQEYEPTPDGNGMYGPHGYRPWNGYKLAELEKLAEGQMVRWSEAT